MRVLRVARANNRYRSQICSWDTICGFAQTFAYRYYFPKLCGRSFSLHGEEDERRATRTASTWCSPLSAGNKTNSLPGAAGCVYTALLP